LQQRTHQLDEIANSIASLAELFKDLSVLVIDQGTLLDSVEYNIEQTAVRVGDAVKELQDATRYQKNTGRRKCIFLLLLIIFGLVIVLIFKPRRHASSPPPSVPADPVTGPGFGTPLRLRSTNGRGFPLSYPPPRLSYSNSAFDVWELRDGTAGYSILGART